MKVIRHPNKIVIDGSDSITLVSGDTAMKMIRTASSATTIPLEFHNFTFQGIPQGFVAQVRLAWQLYRWLRRGRCK